jgi:hypothetical protein
MTESTQKKHLQEKLLKQEAKIDVARAIVLDTNDSVSYRDFKSATESEQLTISQIKSDLYQSYMLLKHAQERLTKLLDK